MNHLRPAILLTLIFVALAGFVFPGIIWGVGQAVFPNQANGSMLKDAKGNVIGSALIGQNFAKPEYFHPRPSAAGSGYDAANSGGTNLGPTSDKLLNSIHRKLPDGKNDPGKFDGIKYLAEAYRKENGLAADTPIPADAATRSASGLDPHISPENARVQLKRVADSRHIPREQVQKLILQNTDGPFLGIFGEPGVNVLKLNLALDGAGR